MRYTGPKARLCRREGINLFGSDKYDKILAKRPQAPGQHGAKGSKLSGYGKQLREKQKVRIMYGLSEKQLRKLFADAKKMEGMTSLNMMKLLEQRLDNVVYRAGFARTRMQARQMVNHGHFMLNGHRVTTPSIRVKAGDTFQVRDKAKNSPLFQGFKELKSDISPSWINVTKSNLSIEVKSLPGDDDIEHIIDPALIVEFYSR